MNPSPSTPSRGTTKIPSHRIEYRGTDTPRAGDFPRAHVNSIAESTRTATCFSNSAPLKKRPTIPGASPVKSTPAGG